MRVLIADDDPVSRLRLERLLHGWSYSVVAVADGAQAWKILSGDDAPKLAILDWMMPGLDGVSVCRSVRALDDDPHVYLILHSTRCELDDLVEATTAGADDYLVKPCQPQELEVRLRAGKRIVELQEELTRARQALHEQATHDALTGACNRRAILATLDQELARNQRGGGDTGCGVVIADLDHFKRVNDRHGRLAGDEVLREVVRRISAHVRQYDSLGRLGGEEFLILLANCRRDQMEAAGERIRGLLTDRPIETAGGPISVTLSLGAAWIPSGHKATVRQTLNAADRALYAAKNTGRDRLCCDEDRPADRRLLLFDAAGLSGSRSSTRSGASSISRTP